MNIEEAKAVLRFHRPGQTEDDDPEIVRALDLVSTNTALAEWWATECTFDSAVAAQLESESPPAELRERILTGASPAQTTAARTAAWWRSLPAIAAAAAIFITAAGFWLHQAGQPKLDRWQTGSLDVLTQVLAGGAKLDIESSNSKELRAWLTQAAAPSPGELPSGFERLKSLGCKTVNVGGEKVSIICFHIDATRLAHLVTVDAPRSVKASPVGRPQFIRSGDWMTASWSNHGQSFMLAMKGTEEELRELLAPVA